MRKPQLVLTIALSSALAFATMLACGDGVIGGSAGSDGEERNAFATAGTGSGSSCESPPPPPAPPTTCPSTASAGDAGVGDGGDASTASSCSTLSCPSLALYSFTAWQDKKKNGCCKTAPESWKPMPGSGTGEGSIDWLYCFTQMSTPKYAFSCFGELVCGGVGCTRDYLPGSVVRDIRRSCKDKKTDYEKVLCAGRKVREYMDDNKEMVCRHHAIALWNVLPDLGIKANLECGWSSGGHAWVEVTVGGKRCLVDAYNNIYICVD